MAYREKEVSLFKSGIINQLDAETLPPGSASDELGFLSLGDKIELTRGIERLGDSETDTGHVDGMGVGTDVEGNQYLFKYFNGIIKIYSSVADTWDDFVTYGTPLAEDMLFTANRTPAGAYVWASSPNTGLVRINLAANDIGVKTYSDFYGVGSDTWRGYIKAADNRLWMWGVNEYGSVFWGSHKGDDFPYTTVTGQSFGTGAPPQVTFNHTAANTLLVGRSIAVTDGVETFTDDGNGVLTGDAGGTGTVVYTTGACSVTFAVAPGGGTPITMDYKYEVPYTNGLADFGYSTPRTALEAFFITQYDDNSEIRNMHVFDGHTYVGHQNAWWDVQLSADDSDLDKNEIFRSGTGIPSIRASVSTGEGIYYIDDTDQSNKVIRRIQVDRAGQKIRPVVVSEQLNLETYDFSDAAAVQFGDYVIFACRTSSDVNHNDTLLLYNERFELWDVTEGYYRDFAVYNSKLYGGSSINGDVYEIFTGFDEEGNPIEAYWITNDDDLDSDELKKIKKIIVEGDIGTPQELIVEASYDFGAWVEIGRVDGDGDYVDKSTPVVFGSRLYGTGPYGSGESVTAYRYMKEFKVNSDKFQTIRLRFRTEEFGYLSLRSYVIKDIRLCGRRVPSNYR